MENINKFMPIAALITTLLILLILSAMSEILYANMMTMPPEVDRSSMGLWEKLTYAPKSPEEWARWYDFMKFAGAHP